MTRCGAVGSAPLVRWLQFQSLPEYAWQFTTPTTAMHKNPNFAHEFVEFAAADGIQWSARGFKLRAIEAMKDGLSETGNGMENLLLYKAVCLVFRPGKKVLGDSLNLRLWNKSSARTATWFRRDEDKDDKKRRAELILRQSMKNQQELTQLRVPVEAKHRQFLAFFQDYWNTETGWDREQLRDILPEDMMKKLDLYILSPVEEDVDDYYWTFEESGNFSISSAYALTNYGSRYNGDYDRSLGYSKGRRMGLEKKILKTNRAK
nr:transcription initiation factor TFIID subunit 8 [Ipomoea batatas]